MMIYDWIGCIDYAEALQLQQQLVAEQVTSPECDDTLLLLEHPPTYTLGKRGDVHHLLLDETRLEEEGFSLYRVDRGGDITYHGPGQLVGYPIINIKRLHGDRIDLHRYVHNIEEILIQTLAEFDVAGWRYKGYTGVWVDSDAGPAKIAAIGIRVNSKGISSHGFALNVATNLDHFNHIIPCGIQEHGVTSLSALVQRLIAIDDILQPIIEAFQNVFGVDMRQA
ncbi:lipoyl(octanoyl) transferase [candidate division KSB3 bacterium]|uniref:Octanoyltransferase n=1 Tax=candidate division KSB3 bacterium TaxID=2044937 RepID=A0A2G6KMI1_9BACT|nr:MAG: lipoyl(octanoyl) transferase [candidate division KSB3 bacterium]